MFICVRTCVFVIACLQEFVLCIVRVPMRLVSLHVSLHTCNFLTPSYYRHYKNTLLISNYTAFDTMINVSL